MLDPKSSTIPGLIVGQDGHVAKKPELGALRSAEVNARDGREIVGNEEETRGGSSTGYKGGGEMTDGMEGSSGDFFSDMGTARKKKEVNKPDPDKVRCRSPHETVSRVADQSVTVARLPLRAQSTAQGWQDCRRICTDGEETNHSRLGGQSMADDEAAQGVRTG